MQWFEYIIILVAVVIVLLPIFLTVYAKKKGKPSPYRDCGHGCGNCDGCAHRPTVRKK